MIKAKKVNCWKPKPQGGMVISSRALQREKPAAKKVHRLSRKGVPDKRRGSTLTLEGANDIVSAISKDMEWSG